MYPNGCGCYLCVGDRQEYKYKKELYRFKDSLREYEEDLIEQRESNDVDMRDFSLYTVHK